MSTFKFMWKRRLIWRSKIVTGFGYQKDMDRMALHFEDGSILEIPKWSKCHCLLGSDYFRWQLKKKELEAGQKIPTEVKE